MPTPAYPQIGDIWQYSRVRYKHPDEIIKYHVIVLEIASDGSYLCLTFENGDVDYWNMDVDDEPDNWRWLA